MVDILSHRGPDADGFLVQGPVAMGMRRLSIIDLAGGDQPIFNEDRSIAVIMNGELFNYVELREWLISKGHRFSTKSDTEILVHLYEEYGLGLLPKLNGMFANGQWDSDDRLWQAIADQGWMGLIVPEEPLRAAGWSGELP